QRAEEFQIFHVCIIFLRSFQNFRNVFEISHDIAKWFESEFSFSNMLVAIEMTAEITFAVVEMKSFQIFQAADFIKVIQHVLSAGSCTNIKSLNKNMTRVNTISDAIASGFIMNELKIFEWPTYA